MKVQKFIFVIFLTVSCSLFAQVKNDPVIMTINGNPVTKSEFEYIYNKNNSTNAIDKKTLDEYVELFINFKLKVEEAKTQGLDTTASFIREFAGYRAQLAAPYLTDSEAEEAVLKEAYKRMKEDVEVSHILVRVPQNATAADTLAAWKRVQDIERRLRRESFEQVAREVSEDQSVVENGGYIGWISAFTTIYPFETRAFDTPAGTISTPVRTTIGYHIIKVHNRRAALGEVLTSHIMIFTNAEDAAQNARAKHKIDSLYRRVLAGDDFGRLASQYSEDRGSAVQGGELPWFGMGRMVPEFESAAFALSEIGNVSEPIQSMYGWHIVKLLDRRGIPSFDEARPEIERMIRRDERANAGQRAFVASLKEEYNLQIETENVNEFIVLLEGKRLNDAVFQAQIEGLNKPLISFADQKYSQADFAEFLRTNTISNRVIASEIINEKLNDFISRRLLAFEDTQLARKHEEFRLLSQEYHDGILLFEISNRTIWERSTTDSEGLTAFFNANRANYTWDAPRFKGRVVHAKDRATEREARRIIRRSPSNEIDRNLQALNAGDARRVRVERGLFLEGENQAIDADRSGFRSRERFIPSEEFPRVFVSGRVLHAPEEYSDVRGLVVTDFQAYLEEQWIKYLRAKFPVVVYHEVLKMVKEN